MHDLVCASLISQLAGQQNGDENNEHTKASVGALLAWLYDTVLYILLFSLREVQMCVSAEQRRRKKRHLTFTFFPVNFPRAALSKSRWRLVHIIKSAWVLLGVFRSFSGADSHLQYNYKVLRKIKL